MKPKKKPAAGAMIPAQFNALIGLMGAREPERTAARLVLVDGLSLAEAAEQTGASPATCQYLVRRLKAAHRDVVEAYDPVVARFGVDSDRVIARDLGLSFGAVQQWRERLGITGIQSGRQVGWTPEMIARLGVETDVALAREWKVSTLVVAYKRAELGIPAKGRKRPPTFHLSRKKD